MKYVIAVYLVCTVFCATRPVAFAQEVDRCGVESERAESIAVGFLNDGRHAGLLALDDIDPPPVESLRVMTHAEDPEACADIALIKEEVERESFFYVAGDYYFRITLPRPPSHWVDRDGIMDGPRGIFSLLNSERELIVMYLL